MVLEHNYMGDRQQSVHWGCWQIYSKLLSILHEEIWLTLGVLASTSKYYHYLMPASVVSDLTPLDLAHNNMGDRQESVRWECCQIFVIPVSRFQEMWATVDGLTYTLTHNSKPPSWVSELIRVEIAVNCCGWFWHKITLVADNKVP